MDATILRSQRAHDELPFEELARRYNFEKTTDRARVFTRLIVEECQKRSSPVRVLDIGCGRGIARQVEYQWSIRGHADEYWGLEPDEHRIPPAGLFDHHCGALLEDADLPTGWFDVAYSSMVMEHVSDPESFMQSVWRCLRPGGVYMFMTPNQKHYFARITSLMRALRTDELLLRAIRGSAVDEYHYPIQYRFNKERRINLCAQRLRFLPPEYAYLESVGPIAYLPGPLRAVFHLLALKRRIFRNPKSLLTLVCRMTKPRQ